MDQTDSDRMPRRGPYHDCADAGARGGPHPASGEASGSARWPTERRAPTTSTGTKLHGIARTCSAKRLPVGKLGGAIIAETSPQAGRRYAQLPRGDLCPSERNRSPDAQARVGASRARVVTCVAAACAELRALAYVRTFAGSWPATTPGWVAANALPAETYSGTMALAPLAYRPKRRFGLRRPSGLRRPHAPRTVGHRRPHGLWRPDGLGGSPETPGAVPRHRVGTNHLGTGPVGVSLQKLSVG